MLVEVLLHGLTFDQVLSSTLVEDLDLRVVGVDLFVQNGDLLFKLSDAFVGA